jgi:hypothetical protein
MEHWLVRGILSRDRSPSPNEARAVLFHHTALCKKVNDIKIKVSKKYQQNQEIE